jgi:uncharacterized protein YfaP (DUF2135 family)
MSKRNLALTVALVLLALSFTVAATNPFLGTWKLNEAKSHFPAAAGKNTTVTYTAAADGMITIVTDGVDGKGNPVHGEWTGKFDGKPFPVTGGTNGVNMRTLMAKGERRLIMTNLNGVKPVSKGSIEVSSDGQARTVDITGTGPDGKPYKATYFYDKQ